MGKLFNPDNKIFTFMGKVGDLILLNVLWLICCIPIITIVPATAALYYVTLKIARKEEPNIVKPFFHSFRQNLKQGIPMTLLFLALGILLFIDIRIAFAMENALGQILLPIFIVLCIFLAAMVSYACPLQAQFYNPIRTTLKNSLILSAAHPLRTLVILVLNLIPIALLLFGTYYFIITTPVWLMLGFSLIALLNSYLFVKSFAKYMPPEDPIGEEEIEIA